MVQDQARDSNDKFRNKIKQTWGRLSDEDVALYAAGKQDQFFNALEQKHGVPRSDAEDRLEEIKESCGDVSSKAA